MVFGFVFLQMCMHNPLNGLLAYGFCLKLPQGLYYMFVNCKGSGKTGLICRLVGAFAGAYVISTLFLCACSNKV